MMTGLRHLKKIVNVALISIAALGLASCGKDPEPEPTNVYVAGWVDAPSNAGWWTNSAFVKESMDDNDVVVTCAFVTPNGDVYHGGYIEASPYPLPVYWLNGVRSALPSPKGGTVSGIAVVDNVIFASGTSDSKAVLWKDGLITELFSRSPESATYGLVLYGKDPHMVGYDGRPVIWSWERNILGVIDDNLDGRTIYAIGNDVYVGGKPFNSTAPAWWVQGKTYNATLSSGFMNSEVRSIFVHGGNVYLAGSQSNGSKTVATYWVDGVPTIIESNENSEIKSIFVTPGKSVLAAGVVYTNPQNPSPAFWKDGTLTSLPGSGQGSGNVATPLYVVGY